MVSKKKKLDIGSTELVTIKPITDTQTKVFDAWKNDKNLFLYGMAGTGKTFISLYLALKEVLKNDSPYERVYLVRSLLPTREIGFLPGDEEDKSYLYQIPYQNMVRFMFSRPDDTALRNQGTIDFLSTSFLRGITIDNGIIIVDECQNLNFHELDTIITRVGQNTKIIFSGDIEQTDLMKTNERNGILNFQSILNNLPEFECVEFGIPDIVRSGLLKSYLIEKIRQGKHYE
jgi:predicted ribonuclease YlaK